MHRLAPHTELEPAFLKLRQKDWKIPLLLTLIMSFCTIVFKIELSSSVVDISGGVMKYTVLVCIIFVLIAGMLCALQQPEQKESSRQEPKLIKKVEPEYPEVAKSARIQGVVILEATITKKGDVVNVKVLREPSPLLTKPAIDAVKQWKYEPGKIDGNVADVIVTLTVNFSLTQEKEEKSESGSLEDSEFEKYAPKIIKHVDPVYPEEASKDGIEGKVVLDTTIDEKGNVIDCQVAEESKPQPLLEKAAIDAVKQWKYEYWTANCEYHFVSQDPEILHLQ
jgi:TonB family protein